MPTNSSKTWYGSAGGGFDWIIFKSEVFGFDTPWTRKAGAPTPPLDGLAITARVSLVSGETGWFDGIAQSEGMGSVVAAVTAAGVLHAHEWNTPDGLAQGSGFIVDVILFPQHSGRFQGRPAILQGDYAYRKVPAVEIITRGHYGDLELIVPDRTGGVFHFSHDCGTHSVDSIAIGERWVELEKLDGPIYDEISLLESTFASGDRNNLELIGRRQGQRGFDDWFRDDHDTWHGPFVVGEPFQSATDNATERARAMRTLARALLLDDQASSAHALLGSAAALYATVAGDDVARLLAEILETVAELGRVSAALAEAPGLASEAVDAQQSGVDLLLGVPAPHDAAYLNTLVSALLTLIERLFQAHRAPETFLPFEQAITTYRGLGPADASADRLLELSATAAGATATAPSLVIPAVDAAQAALDVLTAAHPTPHDAVNLGRLGGTQRILAERLLAAQRAPEAVNAAHLAVAAYTEGAALDPGLAGALVEAEAYVARLVGG